MKLHARLVMCLILGLVVLVSCEEVGTGTPGPPGQSDPLVLGGIGVLVPSFSPIDPPVVALDVPLTDDEKMTFGIAVGTSVYRLEKRFRENPSSLTNLSGTYDNATSSFDYTYTDFDVTLADSAVYAGTDIESVLFTGTHTAVVSNRVASDRVEITVTITKAEVSTSITVESYLTSDQSGLIPDIVLHYFKVSGTEYSAMELVPLTDSFWEGYEQGTPGPMVPVDTLPAFENPGLSLSTDAEYINFGLGLYSDIIAISGQFQRDGFPPATQGIVHSYPDDQSYEYTYSNFDRGSHIGNPAIPAGSVIYEGTYRVDHPSIDNHPARDMTRYIENMQFTVTVNDGDESQAYAVRLITKTYNAGPPIPVEVTFTTCTVGDRSFTQEELKEAHPEIEVLL